MKPSRIWGIDYELVPTPVPGAFPSPWIFPRAKNVPPARFLNALSNPTYPSETKRAILSDDSFVSGGAGGI